MKPTIGITTEPTFEATAKESRALHAEYKKARESRDARFDGQFYIAVKTTGIFCRPICPATTPKEVNVEYFSFSAQALKAGYRPCLRCRPDSAPGSWAWQGVETTFKRAVKLIEEGALQEQNLQQLSDRLGITDRYLRQLFNRYLGMSPKQYSQYQQLMFAKQLLHNSNIAISDIAFASGFNSIRRFNDAFVSHLKLTPTQIRKTNKPSNLQSSNQHIELTLAFRGEFNWQHMSSFYQLRALTGVEEVTEDYYQRTFQLGNQSEKKNASHGWFKVHKPSTENTLKLEISLDDMRQLKTVVNRIRRVFDLDANTTLIDKHLKQTVLKTAISSGLRIPGIWDTFEAGVRAILGQQVSIKAAITHTNNLVANLGSVAEETDFQNNSTNVYFPTPEAVANHSLDFLKIPNSRRGTLIRFAQFYSKNPNALPAEWINIKGIGPWTIQYACMRGLSEPDHFLETDLVIKKAIKKVLEDAIYESLEIKSLKEALSPWGSYATFYCWNTQS